MDPLEPADKQLALDNRILDLELRRNDLRATIDRAIVELKQVVEALARARREAGHE